jgi:hypothetical protein
MTDTPTTTRATQNLRLRRHGYEPVKGGWLPKAEAEAFQSVINLRLPEVNRIKALPPQPVGNPNFGKGKSNAKKAD